jgi:hypothetical protein
VLSKAQVGRIAAAPRLIGKSSTGGALGTHASAAAHSPTKKKMPGYRRHFLRIRCRPTRLLPIGPLNAQAAGLPGKIKGHLAYRQQFERRGPRNILVRRNIRRCSPFSPVQALPAGDFCCPLVINKSAWITRVPHRTVALTPIDAMHVSILAKQHDNSWRRLAQTSVALLQRSRGQHPDWASCSDGRF